MHPRVKDALASEGIDPAAFAPDPAIPGAYTGIVPGERAVAIWRTLSLAHAATGLWPLLRGDPARAKPPEPLAAPLPALLQAVRPGSVRDLLAARLRSFCGHSPYEADSGRRDPVLDPTLDFVTLAKLTLFHQEAQSKRTSPEDIPWPGAPTPLEPDRLVCLDSVSIRSPNPRLPSISLHLLPVDHPADFAVLLSMGGGGLDEFPEPVVISGVLRDWSTRFGASPVAATHDTIELFVQSPPQTRDESLALAYEHYVFCPDRVRQDCGDLRMLAIDLWQSPHWYFWWD